MGKAEQTKQLIIEKSAALFNQKGYSGTSIKDITDATGLTKGGLYGNFEGKEEIAIASFCYAVDMVTEKIGERTRSIPNTLDKLIAVVHFYRENIFSPPVEGGCPILNTSTESDDANSFLREYVVKAVANWQSRLIYTIKKGIDKGEIKKTVNPEEFAVLFIGFIEGGIMLSRIQRNSQSMQIMTKRLLEMLENELRP